MFCFWSRLLGFFELSSIVVLKVIACCVLVSIVFLLFCIAALIVFCVLSLFL